MNEPQTPIRLAFRIEGAWWVAYIAQTGSMERAIELGRILHNAALAREDVGARWKALMRDVLASTLEAVGAQVEAWSEERAPESERSGRA